MRIIAWTYDADYHCAKCAMERFSCPEHDLHLYQDSEGNSPTPVYSIDEWFHPGPDWEQATGGMRTQALTCGDCREELDTYIWEGFEVIARPVKVVG